MGREPQDSSVHKVTRNQEQSRAASVFQWARAEAGGQAWKNRCWLGRSVGAGSAEGHGDSVLARTSVACASGQAGIPRNSFKRLLFGSGLARGAALCSGSDERCGGKSFSGRETAHSGRRILYVGGVRQSRKRGFADLAEE